MGKVLLSFDIEEFDMPLEYGRQIPFAEQIKVSEEGTAIVLDLLRDYEIKATFFCTANFAIHAPATVRRVVDEGHELASHGYFHSSFNDKDLAQSKSKLEEISSVTIHGFRMARMMPVNNAAIEQAGYTYNSSLNPVFIPGRYNNFFKPRTVHREGNLLQIPASATRFFRIPLFWLSFHNFPLWFYRFCCRSTMKSDNYLNLYFHPWEFMDLTKEEYGFPGFVSKNSGGDMSTRFRMLIEWMKGRGYEFSSVASFCEERRKRPRLACPRPSVP